MGNASAERFVETRSKAGLGPSLDSLMLRINYTRLFSFHMLIGMRMPTVTATIQY